MSPLCLHRSERIDHGLQRFRIGIVAIVDDGDVTQLENLSALVGGRKRGERGDGFCMASIPRSQADGDRGQSVQDIVFADEREASHVARAPP